MHSDPFPTTPDVAPRRGHRASGQLKPQSDGRKPIPHIITGLLAISATLVIAHFSPALHGQAGAPGVTTTITKTAPVYGLCLAYNPHASGVKRFQLTTPKSDKNGLWCPGNGKLVTALPGK